jgi:hypothetical protein
MAITASDVRLIMNVSITKLPDATVSPFLTAAEDLVDTIFASGEVVSDTLMEEIKKWLTAHMIASTIYKFTSEEKLGDASVKYTGKWGSKLESTPYGQMVLILDTTGKMANMGKMSAGIFAVPEFDE